ncbi:hypothetical protein [Chlorobium sp. KB01]|uniref:hypothetical protein n=1 Tax=Chlorobium sp. KB01 TaxID=1917528 RepID=UPI0011870FE2|nr:hypothetical protein [Chlorobium sp. KB01]
MAIEMFCLRWKSDIWEIHEGRIDTITLNGDSDLPSWGYSDRVLSGNAPVTSDAQMTLYILNVPLQDNYYFRRLADNVACMSFFEIADALRSCNIPLENAVLRLIYGCALMYTRKRVFPSILELSSFAHHETKGCIFDMAGIKTDIIFSSNNPILCESCCVAASGDQVPNEFLATVKKEIQGIKKHLYYQIADVIKLHPLLALTLSSIFAIILGTIGSLVAAYISK